MRAVTATAFLLLAACEPDDRSPGRPSEGATEWPAGTVLAVDDVLIQRREVDAAVERIRLLYPEHSQSYRRRQALSTFVLPRAAMGSVHAAERGKARTACEEALAKLRRDPAQAPSGPTPLEVTGTWEDLSLFRWSEGRALEPGAWSGCLEEIGRFVLIRLDGRFPAEIGPVGERLALTVLEFPYLPEDLLPADLDAVLGRCRLTIVDPAFEDLVDERLKYLMRGEPR